MEVRCPAQESSVTLGAKRKLNLRQGLYSARNRAVYGSSRTCMDWSITISG